MPLRAGQRWEKALAQFLDEVPFRRHTIGVLVCGSFVTGDPGPRSDVDVHLVLRRGNEWRERGNRIIDGVPIEYFANSPEQIREYFLHEHASNGRMTATMFATGRILSDPEGEVAHLVKEAHAARARPFRRPDRVWLEAHKYALFDALDNLEDAALRRAPDVAFVYHRLVADAQSLWAHAGGEAVPSTARAHRLLTNARTRRKYLEPAPRDARAAHLLAVAIAETDPKAMPRRARALVSYILDGLGGFAVDGWRLRSRPTTARK